MAEYEKTGLEAIFLIPGFEENLDTYLDGLKAADRQTAKAAKSLDNALSSIGTAVTGGTTGAALGGPLGMLAGLIASGGFEKLLPGPMVLINAFKKLTGAEKEVGQQSVATAEDVSTLDKIFEEVEEAIAAATERLVEFGAESLVTAGHVDELTRGALVVAQRMGYTRDETQDYIDALIDQGIRADVAARLILQMSRYQLDLAQATELANVAMNQAVIAGRDTSDVLEALTEGITKHNARQLQTQYILTTQEQAFGRYAQSIGKAADDLNEAEKVQAFFNAVLEEGARSQGLYAAAMESPTKALRSLGRETFNLQAALGTPFLGAWNKVVQAQRMGVQTLTDMVSEGGALYPVLIHLGAALELLADEGIKALQWLGGVMNQWIEESSVNFGDWIVRAGRWGSELIANFAEGIIDGVADFLTVAMDYISDFLAYWLAPGSPPRVAPGLPKWGKEAMAEYLRGFTEADFGVLEKLQAPLRRLLSGPAFAGVSQEIARALTEGPDEAFWKRLGGAVGGFAGEITELARREFALAAATDAVVAAQGKMDESQREVVRLTEEYNALLREGADRETLRAKLAQINAAEEARDAAAEEAEAARENVEAAADQASAQERLVKQLVDLATQQERARRKAAKARKRERAGAAMEAMGLPAFDVGQLDLGTKIGEAIEAAKAVILEKARYVFQPLVDAWEHVQDILFGKEMFVGGMGGGGVVREGALIEDITAFVDETVAKFEEMCLWVVEKIDKVQMAMDNWRLFLEGAMVAALENVANAVGLDPSRSVLAMVVALGEYIQTRLHEEILTGLVDYMLEYVVPAWEKWEKIVARVGEAILTIAEALKRIILQWKKMGEKVQEARDRAAPFMSESLSPLEKGLEGSGKLMDELTRRYLPQYTRALQQAAGATQGLISAQVNARAGGGAGATYNETTWAPQANFNVGGIYTPMDQATFDAMANNWFRRSMPRR